jgi:predicted ABC-type ATPase
MTQVPAIYVLAGVNGSGKSSIGGAALRSRGVEYYNPDEAARQIRSIHPSMTQAIANGHAWTLGRDLLVSAIVKQQTFVFETTLGGTSITELLIEAAQKGFRVKVWYAGLNSVELNIGRVQQRVAQGGHDIPENKIRQRWDSSRRNLIKLLAHLHSIRLFDNSMEADPKAGQAPEPKLLLHVEAGRIVNPEDLSGAPEWAKPIIAAAMVAYEGR